MNMKRRNGFICPPSLHQLSAWICILIQILLNELSIVPIMPEYIQIFYAVLYHLSLALVLFFGFLSTVQDPTDPLSQLGIYVQSKQKTRFCNTCKSSAQLHSRHCLVCNRCVSHFDHHCKWINNCIGSRNYKNFIFLILSLAFNSLIILIFSLLYIALYYSDRDSSVLVLSRQIERIQGTSLWLAEIMIVLVYSSISFLFAFYLVIFHVYLKFKGITTFDYIESRRVLPSISNDFSLKNDSNSVIVTQEKK